MYYKGPCTLQLKLQTKAVIIHTHYNFFHNCNDFFNSFIYVQRFSQQFFYKNLCENLCSVCVRALSLKNFKL